MRLAHLDGVNPGRQKLDFFSQALAPFRWTWSTHDAFEPKSRRATPRYQGFFEVQVDAQRTGMSVVGRCLDLSEEGLHLVLPTDSASEAALCLPEGEVLRVRVSFGDDMVRIVGQVRWTRVPGQGNLRAVGVRVLTVMESDRAVWERTLDQLQASLPAR